VAAAAFIFVGFLKFYRAYLVAALPHRRPASGDMFVK
jgi:hypothetical protein